MITTRSRVSILPVAVMVVGANVASGQDPSTELKTGYPNKPIHIVTSPPGSSVDFGARLIAQAISGSLTQPLIVDNRPGGLLGDILARAAPDGYTVALGGGAIWIMPLLQKASYDPVKDFSPITSVTANPALIVVHPSLPVKSVKELVALARARPGELNFAQGPAGGGGHLAGALFTAMSGVNTVFVPYKDSGAALVSTITGETQWAIVNAVSAMQLVKSGKLKALAVTTAEPTALAPGLPTVAASGLPGYETASLTGILAPAGTPAAIINRLNQEIVRALNRADVKEKFFASGADVISSSPEQFAAMIKADIAKWGKVIKDANIKVD